jgi:serine/threonine protein phosphatase 1
MRYAISDIHGCNKTLRALLTKLKLKKKDTVFFLGDYIDRGPDAWGVITTVTTMPCKTVHLKGNHEALMISYFDNNGDDDGLWFVNGGLKTMESIPKNEIANVVDWMKKLPLYHEEPDYFLVHANFSSFGSNPFIEDDMLWSRWPSPDMDKPVINGHTPTRIANRVNNKGNICIDGGCVFKTKEGLGNLVAYCLDIKEFIVQENIEQ